MQTKIKSSLAVAVGIGVVLGIVAQANAAWKGTAGQTGNAYKVNAVWCYDWGGSYNVINGVPKYPMWWSYYGASQAQDNTAALNLKNAGAQWLLMYNEPDHTDQANLTTAYALQGYKQAAKAVTAAGLTGIVSPACADDNSTWMQQFMTAVHSQGVRCNGVAVHAYQSTASSFLSYIDGIRNRYGHTLWVTEFAPTDWKSPTAITVANCKTYMATAVPGLKSRTSVKAYSWYCGTLPGTGVLGTAALFDSSGNLTELGTQYKSY